MQTDDIQHAIDETTGRIAEDLRLIELRAERAARAAIGWSVAAAFAIAGTAVIVWLRSRGHHSRYTHGPRRPVRFEDESTRRRREVRATA